MYTYVPPLTEEDLAKQPSGHLPCYPQGYAVGGIEMAICFYDTYGNAMSPYAVFYAVGFLSGEAPNKDFHPYGGLSRIPLNPRTGLYWPNFRVGQKWITGDYLIKWFYQVSEDSPVLEEEVPFLIVTAGIYDTKPLATGSHDVAASVIITP